MTRRASTRTNIYSTQTCTFTLSSNSWIRWPYSGSAWLKFRTALCWMKSWAAQRCDAMFSTSSVRSAGLNTFTVSQKQLGSCTQLHTQTCMYTDTQQQLHFHNLPSSYSISFYWRLNVTENLEIMTAASERKCYRKMTHIGQSQKVNEDSTQREIYSREWYRKQLFRHIQIQKINGNKNL